jgi:hypothetical protein
VTGDRFRTETNYFDTIIADNETFDDNETLSPFKLQYLSNELMERESPEYGSNSNHFETNIGDSDNETFSPFKLQYLSNELMERENPNTNAYLSFSPDRGIDFQDNGKSSEINSMSEIRENEFVENENDLEIFHNEIHDLEFTELIGQIASEAEDKFQNFMSENGSTGAMEDFLQDANHESNFDQFFETNYMPLVKGTENQIDRMSQYIVNNFSPETNYEDAKTIIESFQVEPEQLFGIGKIINKVKKGLTGVVNTAKSVAAKAGGLVLGPILTKILSYIKPRVASLIKGILQKAMGKFPEKYRTIAQKALDALSLSAKGEISPDRLESEIMPGNSIGESKELLDEHSLEVDTLENQLYGVDDFEREFDKELFLVSQDLSKRPQPNLDFQYENPEESEAIESEAFLDSEVPQAIESEFTLLNRARDELISGLTGDSPNVKDLTQNFIPMILPALKLGIKLVGRDKVINTIANVAAPVIGKIVGKEQAAPLSRVIIDQGLKLVQLESPEMVTRENYVGNTIANIISETVDRVSELPDSILDAGEDVLQSFVKDELMATTANNVHFQVLKDDSLYQRNLPKDANWVLRREYKKLSKEYKTVLQPEIALRINTRRGETLADVLHNYQGWDRKSPVPVVIYVFEATPLTRLTMIAKDYAGGSSHDQIRQIIRLGPKAATLLLNEPKLAVSRRTAGPIAGGRFYYVQIQKPDAMSSSPSVVREKDKGDVADLRFVPPNKLEIKLFLGKPTTERIKNMAGNLKPAELYKVMESILLPTGRAILSDLFTRLRIPSFGRDEISSQILVWVIKNCKSNLTTIVQEFMKETSKAESGITIQIDLGLPEELLKDLTQLGIEKIGGFISKLFMVNPSSKIKITAGYNL